MGGGGSGVQTMPGASLKFPAQLAVFCRLSQVDFDQSIPPAPSEWQVLFSSDKSEEPSPMDTTQGRDPADIPKTDLVNNNDHNNNNKKKKNEYLGRLTLTCPKRLHVL